MALAWDVAGVVAGVVLLALGGESLIRGALAAARRLSISPLLTGLVIVGFGTSMPELVVSLDAARLGNSDIAIGNVVGSNIGNVLFILGVCAMISPLKVAPTTLRRDALVVVAATGMFMALAAGGVLSRIEGAFLLVLLLAYVAWTYIQDRKHPGAPAALHEAEGEAIHALPKSSLVTGIAIIVGLGLLIAGAQILINSATGLAEALGASEAVIGLTVVALGTSFPELTVSVIAAIRRQGDVAIGNILGSNTFNLLGVLGLSAIVQPLTISDRIAGIDQWVMLGAAVILVGFLMTGRRLGRAEGAVLLAGYSSYVWLSFALG